MTCCIIKFLLVFCAFDIDDLPDRNCDKCVQCCVDYEGWLQFQNCLYKVSIIAHYYQLSFNVNVML